MADQVQFELVAPERLLISDEVEMVVVPGAEGDFGVLPGHAPFISTVRPGVISVYENGAVGRRVFVSGGFSEVTSERCTVLADEAISLDDVDRAAAESRLRAAEQADNDAEDDADHVSATAELEISRALLVAVERADRG
jgi:F-type H+-transporting ATPase subunit epsilon